MASISRTFTALLKWTGTAGQSLAGETINFEYALQAAAPSWKSAGSATTNSSFKATKTISLTKGKTYFVKTDYEGNTKKSSKPSSVQITVVA